MQYRSHQSSMESNKSFTIRVEDLIREIVIQNDIPYYRIESSVETNEQAGTEDSFMPVIRVITYFEDTVNKISHILHEEFDVDIEKSMDKKKIRIETFAYKNINYTAKLKLDRQQQTVYKRSGDKKFEIQICSMLQDAWGGIEKELGYDKTFVPDEAKRDFYRVGALLEMADIEFLKIRTELGKKLKESQSQPSQDALVADPNATTFVEHLQAVAQPAPQPQYVAPAPPPPVVQPAPQPQYVAPAPPPVVAQPAPQPQYVAPAPPPVIEQPAPQPQYVAPAPPPVVAQPAPQPQYVAPAPPPQPAVTPVAVTQPIAPQRMPVASQGIAPQPAKAPLPESPAIVAKDTSVDSLKELAQSINNIEHKNAAVTEVPQPAPQPVPQPQPAMVTPPPAPVMQAPPAPQPQPVAVTPPPPVVVAPPAPPVQEVIAPVVEYVAPVIPQAHVASIVDNVSNINVNGNGIIEKHTEIVREIVPEVPAAYFEEPKPVKTVTYDENAQMTDASLREYVMTSKLLKEVDQQIAERAGAKINNEIDIEGDVERLRFLKVYTLKQLNDRILDNKNDIVSFAEKWIGKDNGGSFDSGISLFYLEYLLVGKKNDPAFAVEYVVKFISDNDYSARYIIPTYNSIHNTEAPNFSHLTLKA